MLEHKGLRRRKRQFLYLFNRNCLFYNCIKKTMRYAYGSEKVLPLSKKTSHHARIYIGQPTKIFNTRRCYLMSSDTNSLAHTKWNCKYHIVFAPKYRRQVIYGKIKRDIGVILRQLCERKGVEIIEAEACKDHIHMLVSIPPKLGVSSFVGYLKGKSSLMIFDRHANLKYRYGNRKFWCKGFYVDTVGRNKKVIENYIRNQLQEDIVADQMSMEEYLDPFTGEEIKKRRKK